MDSSSLKQQPKRFIGYHVEFYGDRGLLGGLTMTIALEHDAERLKYAFRRCTSHAILDAAKRVKFYEHSRISA